MKKLLLLLTLPLPFLGSGETLQDVMTFYLPCDDLRPPATGVVIPSTLRCEPGKFGNAFRMERRTLNLAPNGDFQTDNLTDWIYEPNAVRLPQGGINNSACLKISSGESVILPLAVKTGKTYAISFHARGSGSITLSAECAGKTIPLREQQLQDLFTGDSATFFPADSMASFSFTVKGQAFLDNVMVDEGVGYANSFSAPLKLRHPDRISLPVDAKYFNAQSGAISCWVKTPWLDPNVCAESGSAIFAVNCAAKRHGKWGDTTVMSLVAYNRPNNKDNGKRAALNMITVDAEGRSAVLALPLAEVNNPGDIWRHLVFNWELRNGTMHLEIFCDGGKRHVQTAKPFGTPKVPTEYWIGYSGGGYVNGLLDDFAIFSRPLTEKEIQAIHQSGKPLQAMR